MKPGTGKHIGRKKWHRKISHKENDIEIISLGKMAQKNLPLGKVAQKIIPLGKNGTRKYPTKKKLNK